MIDEQCAAIYKEVNGELEGKSKPISTKNIFAAMRLVEQRTKERCA